MNRKPKNNTRKKSVVNENRNEDVETIVNGESRG